MSREELEGTVSSLIIAGSESTAITISGAIHYLLKFPDTLHNLTNEIRNEFSSEADIELEKLNGLVYLSAVLEETLRLFPPGM